MKLETAFTPLAILLGTLVIATVIDGEAQLLLDRIDQHAIPTGGTIPDGEVVPQWVPVGPMVGGVLLTQCSTTATGPCWPVREVSLPAAMISEDGRIVFAPGLTTDQSREVVRRLRTGGVNQAEIYAGQLDPATMTAPRQMQTLAR